MNLLFVPREDIKRSICAAATLGHAPAYLIAGNQPTRAQVLEAYELGFTAALASIAFSFGLVDTDAGAQPEAAARELASRLNLPRPTATR